MSELSALLSNSQLFVVMSIMGTAFWGYFFAFHLFNVVTNNAILQRVVMAVTRNGKLYFLKYGCYQRAVKQCHGWQNY